MTRRAVPTSSVRHRNRRTALAFPPWLLPALFLSLPLALLGPGGCSRDEDPLTPPDPGPDLPTSPAGVLEQLALGLAEQDSVILGALTTADFTFATGTHAEIAGTPVLERSRFNRAVFNLCRRDTVDYACAPTMISTSLMPPETWAEVPPGEDPWAGSLQAEVALQLNVKAGLACRDFAITGKLGVYVRPETRAGRDDSTTVYRLLGLRDETDGCEGDDEPSCLTKLLCAYLPAGLPRARLDPMITEGTTSQSFVLDASASDCSGAGLHEAPFRWRLEPGDGWSAWGTEDVLKLDFDDPGCYGVMLEVRNTLGWISRAETELTVYARRPGSKAELLDTLAYAHRAQDALLIGELLDPDFRFLLAEQDVDDLDLPYTYFSFARMLTATVRLFRNHPGPDDPPLVTAVDFGWSDPYDDETPQLAAPRGRPYVSTHAVRCEIERKDAETLLVDGNVVLTFEPARVLRLDGTTETIWRLYRVEDHSHLACGACPGNTSWGRILAVYYGQ